MKTRVITARVTNDLSYKLQFLKSSLGLSNTTSVVTYAVEALYEATKEQQAQKSSLEMFEENGLFGCIESRKELSTMYKDEISHIVSKKHSRSSSSS